MLTRCLPVCEKRIRLKQSFQSHQRRRNRVTTPSDRPTRIPNSHLTDQVSTPVLEHFESTQETFGKSDYVFLNPYGKNIDPMSMNFHVWKPGLKKAGLSPRSMHQTRHTFATVMLDGGEHPGWVQKMMGHETMQMIYEKYLSLHPELRKE